MGMVVDPTTLVIAPEWMEAQGARSEHPSAIGTPGRGERTMTRFTTPRKSGEAFLGGTHPTVARSRRAFGHVPSDPRCMVCHAPFAGPGGWAFRHAGFKRWDKNPNVCMRCFSRLDGYDVIGAEVEVSFMLGDEVVGFFMPFMTGPDQRGSSRS